MAITFASDVIDISDVATLVAATNSSRESLALRVQSENAKIWLGPDNTVTVDTGWYWKEEDGSFDDATGSTSAYYAICRAGKTAKVSVIEFSH